MQSEFSNGIKRPIELENNDLEIKKEEIKDVEMKDAEMKDFNNVKFNYDNGNNGDIIMPITKAKLSYTPLKTGLVYDVRMRYHAKIFTSYLEYIDPHPEDPRRIYRIYKILAENGLINDPTLCGSDNIGDYMVKIPIREATKEEILAVHTEEHLKFIESTQSMDKDQLLKETEKGDSVYFNNDTLLSAKLSCGGAIEACKAVVEGKVKNSLAIVRPPGHHAEPDSPGGFCLFSNVAVAANAILKSYPESVRKIVIIDWDIHHGNGTQKVFYNDPRVLYISLHRYEQGKYYPGTTEGAADKVGAGEGEGFNVNVPWPTGGVGDADYIYAFRKVILPICQEFNPDLVIISSGFDAADGDVIGGCHVSPSGYGHMTHYLKSLAKGNLCVVLEGGYNLDSIAKSALRVAKVLLGEPPELLENAIPKTETIEAIADVIKIQSRYWKTLTPAFTGLDYTLAGNLDSLEKLTSKSTDPTFIEVAAKNMHLDDAVRDYQRNNLFDKFNFINLPILDKNKASSPSLKSVILASPNIHKSEKIVVIVHDPSRVWARHDPITGTLDPSTAVSVDNSHKFISWAIEQKYGVIDINIPLTVTSLTSNIGSGDDYNNITVAQDTILYLWDNYIQFFSQPKLAFVGVGEAYNGIVHLFGHRDVRGLTKVSVNFLGDYALRAIVSTIDESVPDWFFRNSLVFTSPRHACWGEGKQKRPRKKYGRVLRADTGGLDQILDERFEEACDFIEEGLEEYESDSDSD